MSQQRLPIDVEMRHAAADMREMAQEIQSADDYDFGGMDRLLVAWAERIERWERHVSFSDLPCPECGRMAILTIMLTDPEGEHAHTWYVCTNWPKPLEGAATGRCGWTGYSVPGWDDPNRYSREEAHG